jgi:hypothetical protein
MSNVCHKLKTKDCRGLILDEVQDEEWLYWCAKLDNGWRVKSCRCEGGKYELRYEWVTYGGTLKGNPCSYIPTQDWNFHIEGISDAD